jgi:hypothetical protein
MYVCICRYLFDTVMLVQRHEQDTVSSIEVVSFFLLLIKEGLSLTWTLYQDSDKHTVSGHQHQEANEKNK